MIMNIRGDFPSTLHTSHTPLDVAVNGPFEPKLAVAQNDWQVTRPRKTITTNDLASTRHQSRCFNKT